MAAVPEPLASTASAPLTAVLDMDQLDTMKNVAKKSTAKPVQSLTYATNGKNGIKAGLNGAGHHLVDSVCSEGSTMVNGDIRKRPADGALSDAEEKNPAKIARTQAEELERKQEEEIKKITSPDRSSSSPIAVPVPSKDADVITNGDSNMSTLSDSSRSATPMDSELSNKNISDQGKLGNAKDTPTSTEADSEIVPTSVDNSSPESTASPCDTKNSETNDRSQTEMDCTGPSSNSVHTNSMTVSSTSHLAESSQTIAISPARPAPYIPSAKSPVRERANLFDQMSSLTENSLPETEPSVGIKTSAHTTDASSLSSGNHTHTSNCTSSSPTSASPVSKSVTVSEALPETKSTNDDMSEALDKEEELLGGTESDVESVATNEEMAILDDDDVQELDTEGTTTKVDSGDGNLPSSVTKNATSDASAVTKTVKLSGDSLTKPSVDISDTVDSSMKSADVSESSLGTVAVEPPSSEDTSIKETKEELHTEPAVSSEVSESMDVSVPSVDTITKKDTCKPSVDDTVMDESKTSGNCDTVDVDNSAAPENTDTGSDKDNSPITTSDNKSTEDVAVSPLDDKLAEGVPAEETPITDLGDKATVDDSKVTAPEPTTDKPPAESKSVDMQNENTEPMDTNDVSAVSEKTTVPAVSEESSVKSTDCKVSVSNKNAEDDISVPSNNLDVIDLNASVDSVIHISEDKLKDKIPDSSETKPTETDSAQPVADNKQTEDKSSDSVSKKEDAMEVVESDDDDVLVISEDVASKEKKADAESPPAQDAASVDGSTHGSTTAKRSLSTSAESSDSKKPRLNESMDVAVPSTDLVKALKGDLRPEIKELVRSEDEVKEKLRSELANCSIDDNKVQLSPDALDLLFEQSLVGFVESCQGNVLARLRHRVVNLQACVDKWKGSSRDMMKNIQHLQAAQRTSRRNTRTALRNVSIQVTEARVQAVALQQQRGQKQTPPQKGAVPPNFPQTAQRHVAPNTSNLNQVSPGKQQQIRPQQGVAPNIAPRMPNQQTVRGMLDMQRGINIPPGGLQIVTSANSPRMVARPQLANQTRATTPQQMVTVAVTQPSAAGGGGGGGGRGVIDLTDDDDQNAAPQRATNQNNVLMRSTGQVGMLQQVGGSVVPGNIRPNTATSVANIRPGIVPGTVLVQQTPNSTPVLMQQIRAQNGQVLYTPAQMVRAPAGVRQTLVPGGPPQLRPGNQQLVLRPAGGAIRPPPPLQVVPQTNNVVLKHPAPLPPIPPQPNSNKHAKFSPPKPGLKISRVQQGIVLSWNMTITDQYAEISNYQLFAYQEGSAPPSTSLWKKVGDVKALPLPMACTLTQFQEGNKYHFAVRAIDVRSRIGPFSDPSSIHLTPMSV